MRILNLGCGAKTSADPSVVNIDWSILVRMRASPTLRLLAPLVLNGERLRRFRSLPANLLVHDLSRGIPFPDGSADVVYHSHVLEHLDREVAGRFVCECVRVLRPGGLMRVVVPDFEQCCRSYLDHVAQCDRGGDTEGDRHDAFFEPILLMSVRREAYGTSQQPPLRRFVENVLLGDARKRGETHQWMYDRFNLASLLRSCGLVEPTVRQFDTSSVAAWSALGLDCDETGREYKPESLYMEAIKPTPGQ